MKNNQKTDSDSVTTFLTMGFEDRKKKRRRRRRISPVVGNKEKIK